MTAQKSEVILLQLLSGINALPVPEAYAVEAMDRLRERFLNKALSDVHLPILQAEAEKATEIQKAAANDAEPVKEEQLTAQTWFERGYVFATESKNLEEAIRCFSEAIRLDPNLDAAHNNLGALLTDFKRYDEAEAAYRKAIELNPSDATAYSNLGNLLSDEHFKRYDEAEAAYRKAIELNPSYATAYYNLGILLKTRERYDEAEAAYRKAIELNPSYATAYNNLVIMLRSLNRIEDAMPLLEKAIEIDPKDFNPYLALASISKQLSKHISPEHLDKARKFLPSDDWYNRACLESVCENFDLAFEYLAKATQRGQFDPKWAWQDPDLQWIRDDPRFTAIAGARPK